MISFGLQRHVTSYIRVVHYMSMFCWVDQLNYTYKKPLNFIMCILKKGNSNSASNSWIWGYVLGSINCVQKKAATFADHTSYSVWETLVQRRKIAWICPLFKAYSREGAWKAVGDRLQGPYYLSRDDRDQKIKARKQRTHTGKYSFVNGTIKLWNQLPAEALATFSCRSHIFKKKVRKVI